MLNPSE
jgi:hypothetical protein